LKKSQNHLGQPLSCHQTPASFFLPPNPTPSLETRRHLSRCPQIQQKHISHLISMILLMNTKQQ
jgi:hypothetical protein